MNRKKEIIWICKTSLIGNAEFIVIYLVCSSKLKNTDNEHKLMFSDLVKWLFFLCHLVLTKWHIAIANFVGLSVGLGFATSGISR